MRYEGFSKINCDCGYSGVTFQYGDILECPYCGETNKVTEMSLENWGVDEVCNIWVQSLEDENEHGWVEMPYRIYDILQNYIDDEELIKQIMIDMYNDGLR